MRKLVLLTTLLLSAIASGAQSFYHKQMPPPGGNSLTTLVPLAGGHFALCSEYIYDNLFTILETDANGTLLNYKGYTLHPSITPDSAQYMYFAWFAPTADSGITVTFLQNVISTNPIATDSNRKVIVKLNKQFDLQWAMGKSYQPASSAGPYTGQLLMSNPVSDEQGNLLFAFSIDTTYGLCKIDPAGNILAVRNTSEFPGFYAIRLPGSHTLFLRSDPNTAANTTAFSVYGIDDQLNLYREKHYGINQPCEVFSNAQPPVYNHALIALPASEIISIGGGNTTSFRNGYLIMDTSGNLLQVRTAPGTGISPVQDVSITDSDRLLMCGYDAGWYQLCMDTAGQLVYGLNLNPSGIHPLWTPLKTDDSSLMFLGSRDIASTTASLDLVRYRNVGTYFCPDNIPFTPSPFNPVSFQTAGNTTPVFTSGTLSFQQYTIDTVPVLLPVWQQMCTGTGVTEPAHNAGVPVVYTTDGHTLIARLPGSIYKASLLVTDITGRKIVQQEISDPVQTIQLPALASGIYVWQLVYGNAQRVSGRFHYQ